MEQKAASRKILSELKALTAQIDVLREAEQAYMSHTMLGATKLTGMPKGGLSKHRVDDCIVRAVGTRERIDKLQSQIQEYIDVLRDHRDYIRNPDLKIRILSERYIERKQWDDILYRIYGQEPDYTLSIAKYRRKLMRTADSAYYEIWKYWRR